MEVLNNRIDNIVKTGHKAMLGLVWFDFSIKQKVNIYQAKRQIKQNKDGILKRVGYYS